MLNSTVFPGVSTTGKAGPLTEKAPPVVPTELSVLFQGRTLVSTTESVALVPTAICPKERLEGAAVTASLFKPEPATTS